uniref:Methyltransferase type 11 n=1 Tax=Rhodopseudomonas palustris (strain BisA53) TaxID=316055 RepID=Q07I68_RHOP5
MIAPELPASLKAALDAALTGVARGELAARAAAISNAYRDGGDSGAIKSRADALAYALVRMPATFAAVAASFNALRELRDNFAPTSLLDVGAGPGTASFAAAAAFGSLTRFDLLDANPALRALALDLARDDPRLAALNYAAGDARQKLAEAAPAELVIASYVINELGEAARGALADLLWQKTTDVLLVIEPGTPSGFERMRALRARLIGQGAFVIAPCPHERACPIAAPDWCHFTQRLPRSRAHRQLKAAEVPYEDEKFCYVALSRTKPMLRAARVLAQPLLSKVQARTKLCGEGGVGIVTTPRRDKAAYARVKKLAWGDALIEAAPPSSE